MRPPKHAKRDNFIKFQLSFQPKTSATTPMPSKRQIKVFDATSKTRSDTTFNKIKFQFLANRSPRRLPTRKLAFQRATFNARSVSKSNKGNFRKTEKFVKETSLSFANTKNRTLEMTWRQTASDNVKDNTQRHNKVAVCRSRPLNC